MNFNKYTKCKSQFRDCSQCSLIITNIKFFIAISSYSQWPSLSNNVSRYSSRVNLRGGHRKSQLFHQGKDYSKIHYGGIIMSAIASQITSLTIVYSTVYLDANQRNHQSSASRAFVRGIHRGPVNYRTNGPFRENISTWWRHHELFRLFWKKYSINHHCSQAHGDSNN